MKVKVKKLSEDANLPKYATEGSACFDLRSLESFVMYEGDPKIVGTGLAFEIPKNTVLLLFPRSGLAVNQGIRLENCVGVIDSDFRGEVKVPVTKDSSLVRNHVTMIEKGERIAQGMIVPYIRATLEEVEELSNTERGEGGFGSTGRN